MLALLTEGGYSTDTLHYKLDVSDLKYEHCPGGNHTFNFDSLNPMGNKVVIRLEDVEPGLTHLFIHHIIPRRF